MPVFQISDFRQQNINAADSCCRERALPFHQDRELTPLEVRPEFGGAPYTHDHIAVFDNRYCSEHGMRHSSTAMK